MLVVTVLLGFAAMLFLMFGDYVWGIPTALGCFLLAVLTVEKWTWRVSISADGLAYSSLFARQP